MTMDKTEKVTTARCMLALLKAIVFSALGIAVSVILSILFGALVNFLCGIKYVGWLFELLSDFINESFVGAIIGFICYCLIGFAAGFGCKNILCDSNGKDIKASVTVVICFVVAVAATFLAKLLLCTYDIYILAQGSVSIYEAFKLSPQLYIYSEHVNEVIMIIIRDFLLLVNSILGFGLGSGAFDNLTFSDD